jgi:hypothetical protein
MKPLSQIKKALVIACVIAVWSLVFVNAAPAPPPPPPPPSGPAAGDVAQTISMGVIAAYGAWTIWRKK